MATHAKHPTPVSTRSATTTHVLVLDEAEFQAVFAALESVTEAAGWPRDHQLNGVLAAMR